MSNITVKQFIGTTFAGSGYSWLQPSTNHKSVSQPFSFPDSQINLQELGKPYDDGRFVFFAWRNGINSLCFLTGLNDINLQDDKGRKGISFVEAAQIDGLNFKSANDVCFATNQVVYQISKYCQNLPEVIKLVDSICTDPVFSSEDAKKILTWTHPEFYITREFFDEDNISKKLSLVKKSNYRRGFENFLAKEPVEYAESISWMICLLALGHGNVCAGGYVDDLAIKNLAPFISCPFEVPSHNSVYDFWGKAEPKESMEELLPQPQIVEPSKVIQIRHQSKFSRLAIAGVATAFMCIAGCAFIWLWANSACTQIGLCNEKQRLTSGVLPSPIPISTSFTEFNKPTPSQITSASSTNLPSPSAISTKYVTLTPTKSPTVTSSPTPTSSPTKISTATTTPSPAKTLVVSTTLTTTQLITSTPINSASAITTNTNPLADCVPQSMLREDIPLPNESLVIHNNLLTKDWLIRVVGQCIWPSGIKAYLLQNSSFPSLGNKQDPLDISDLIDILPEATIKSFNPEEEIKVSVKFMFFTKAPKGNYKLKFKLQLPNGSFVKKYCAASNCPSPQEDQLIELQVKLD